MFEYFEGNYTWNMAINLALAMGASIGDIDDASRPLRAVAAQNDDPAAELFFSRWTAMGDKLAGMAAADEAAGFSLSASAKYKRAFIAFIQAERMQRPDFTPREAAFTRALDCFGKFITLGGVNCERVEVPYQGTGLPALFVKAKGGGGRAPCMVHFDGLDVTKEIVVALGMADELAARGISTLIVDNPGVGESLRLRKLHNFPEAEVPGAASIDYLVARGDVDPARIGIMALSLGGYHAPRAAAFEPRFACCVAWGANYRWGETQRMRYENPKASLPVPHYWDHVKWVFGKESMEEVLAVSDKLVLSGILDRVRCPILVVHGENDRQITLAQARQTIDECVNSPRAELKVHTLAEGGAEHCSIDNVPLTREYMADWISSVFGTAGPAR